MYQLIRIKHGEDLPWWSALLMISTFVASTLLAVSVVVVYLM